MTVITGTAVQAATISDAAGTGPTVLTGHQTIKAWGIADLVSTPAFDDSFGMTSITDNATGDMTFNFSVTMSNANYGMALGGTGTSGNAGIITGHHDTITKTTTTHRLYCSNNAAGLIDGNHMSASYIGDLA